ncbi:MAG: glycine oxidase ThiO [Methylococcus sp.]|nr:MAG: glycine oxidase ThiO [Methylococcus sp.]
MNQTCDMLVIGGGIIGLCCAREFSTAGYRVTLIDKQRTGQEASWAGGGILSPLYPWRQPESVLPLWTQSARLYPELAQNLTETTGIDPEWNRCGMVILDPPDPEALAWCNKQSISAQGFDSTQELPSGLDIGLCPRPSLWLPDIAQIRNPRLLAALKKDVEQKGVTIFEDQESATLTVKNNRVSEVRTGNLHLSAGEVIVAAGAWSSKIAADFLPVPLITPVKGEMILYQTKASRLKSIILHNGLYLIPRKDGLVLVGSPLDRTGYDKTPTRQARQQLEDFVRRVFPPLAKSPVVGHWAGLRPGSADGIPSIGRHPGVSNLSFNCGHFRNGLAMAPASARLLAELLTGGQASIPPTPYAITDKIR